MKTRAEKFRWTDSYDETSRAAVRRVAEAMAASLGDGWRPWVWGGCADEGWFMPGAKHAGRGVTVYAMHGTPRSHCSSESLLNAAAHGLREHTHYFASVNGTWDEVQGGGPSPYRALWSLNRLLDRLRARYERARHGPE